MAHGCCVARADRPRLARAVALLVAALVGAPGGEGALVAQGTSAARPRVGGGLLATRAALEARAAERERAGATAEVAALRRRLTDGDFQMGDRVLLHVEGEAELSDTFTVGADRDLTLAGIGAVSLRGVLRSELEAALTAEIGRFVRAPAVRASALILVSVTGEVVTPGFYPMPVNALVADVVMAAGGGSRDARLKALRVERDGTTLWNSALVAQAIGQGRTLDELGLRSGDQFVVPGRSRASSESNLRVVSLLLSIPVTIFTLTRIF